MSPEINRKFNIGAGSFFLVMGLAGWALAGYYAATPNEAKPHPVTAENKIDLGSCRALLGTLGYSASITAKKDAVRAYEGFKESAKDQLERATLAMGLCKLPLKSFCMGEGCDTPGISFELGFEDGRKGTKQAKPAASTTQPVPASPVKK